MLMVVLLVLVITLTGYLMKGRMFAAVAELSGFVMFKCPQNRLLSEKRWNLKEQHASRRPLPEQVQLFIGAELGGTKLCEMWIP